MRTRHAVAVAAPAERALAAALEVTAGEARLLPLLLALRGLRATRSRPLWEDMQAHGFVRFDATTLVAIGKPWRPGGAMLSSAAEAFVGFTEAGWAKLGIDFRVEGGRLVTETRVRLTDEAARRAFRRYWRVVGPFSGLVRRSWLEAARRRAESAPPG